MRSFLLSLFLPVLFLIFTVSAAIAADTETGVTVLIYHRFGEDTYPTTNVAVDRFREQMEFLRENGYNVIPLKSLVHYLQEGRRLPEKAVVITIDDGYKSVYENAWPVLNDFNYPFTVFLYIKATENRHSNYMTWEQVREMKDAGVDFQNHGFAHEHLAFIPTGMNMHEYRAWIRSDLAVSTKIFSERLRERPRFFAVPYGEYNAIVLDEIRSFGYEAIILQNPGTVSSDTDPFAIPREPILGNEWASMEHFQMVLEREDLPVSGEVPGVGQLPDNTPKRFGAHMLHPERYVPGTIGIYVSELGWQQATIEGNFASITNNSTLKRKVNRVAISAREKESGRTAIRFWMLVGE
jgi:peptidoglycan/xylan/chitin deacetylase (PgdA/CDA1 family)